MSHGISQPLPRFFFDRSSRHSVLFHRKSVSWWQIDSSPVCGVEREVRGILLFRSVYDRRRRRRRRGRIRARRTPPKPSGSKTSSSPLWRFIKEKVSLVVVSHRNTVLATRRRKKTTVVSASSGRRRRRRRRRDASRQSRRHQH